MKYGYLKQILYCSAAAGALFVPSGAAVAGPEGGVVAAGSAAISTSGNKTDIHQSSHKAIIDWQSFDIGAHEHTQFHQPSSSSVTLNRIHDSDASRIDGRLTANGRIMLINPNGIVFGAGSAVDVASLTASTADIDNDDFMAGRYDFTLRGATDGRIINHGHISAREAGLVHLVAPHVENHGVIEARLGTVQLAAAEMFTLDLAGDGLIQVALNDEDVKKLALNTGRISAEGGTIAMTAAKARNIVDSLVDNAGIIEATSMSIQGGRVILGGGETGITVNRGILDASGRRNNVQGGEVNVLGQHIAIAAGSLIDASGNAPLPVLKPSAGSDTASMGADNRVKTEAEFLADARRGGGSILIGGDYLGTGDTPRAQTLYVDANSLTLNDGLTHGDGGRTIFWSDHTTDFNGLVLSRGGTQTGNGGFLETSGKINLNATGFADLSPAAGGYNKGTYLLDPADIYIYGDSSGTVGPDYVSTDGTTIDLASDLALWLDASDESTVTLTYSTDALGGATADGTIGTNTITTSADVSANLQVGARIRLGAQGTITTADTLGADTYTITAIAGTTITVAETLTDDYTADNLYRGLVSEWADKASTNDATQIAEADMPLWVDNAQNGNAVLDFDGADRIDSPSNDLGTFFISGLRQSNSEAVWFQITQTTEDRAFTLLANQGTKFVTQEITFLNSLLVQETLNNIDYVGGTNEISLRPLTFNTNLISSGYDTINVKTNTSLGFGYATPGWVRLDGRINEFLNYDTLLSTNERNLVEQYQSLKWGIDLDPLAGDAIGGGTALENEAAEAMSSTAKGDAADGFGAFSTRYLEKLSATADIILAADNTITLDLQGDTLTLADDRSITLTTTNSHISSVSNGSIVTNNVTGGGNITMTAGGNIDLTDITLNAQNSGQVTLTSGTNGSSGTIDLASTGDMHIQSTTTLNTPNARLLANSGTIHVTSGLSSSGAMTLVSDDVEISASVSAPTLALRPDNGIATFGLAGGTGAYNLSTAELNYLSAANLRLGTSANSFPGYGAWAGTMNLNAHTWNNNITGDLILRADAAMNLLGDQNFNGSNNHRVLFYSPDYNISAALATNSAKQLSLTGNNTTFEIGQGANAAGINDTELDFISDGWSLIAIGGETTNVNVFDYSNWRDPVDFLANNQLNILGNQSAAAGSDTAFTIISRVHSADQTHIVSGDLDLTNATGGDGSITFRHEGSNSATYDVGGDLTARHGGISFDEVVNFTADSILTTSGNINILADGDLNWNNNLTFSATGGGTVTVNADNFTSSGTLTLNAGSTTFETAAAGLLSMDEITNSTGTVILKASEIDITDSLTGSGNIQLTSADITQEIEIGSTNAAALNLTAAELGFLQDGFSSITIGDLSQTGDIIINQAVSFSDNVILQQDQTSAGQIILNQDLTTTDNANANFYVGGGNFDQDSATTITVAGDLLIENTTLGNSLGFDGNSNIGGNATLTSRNSFSIRGNNVINGNLLMNGTVTGNASFLSNPTLDIGGDFTLDANVNFNVASTMDLDVDGDITLTTGSINIDPTATISGNADGSSNLTFLEYGEDDAMELGSEGTHTWSMTAAEIATIQDGFNSITFGSTSHDAQIDVTGAVSFSDDASLVTSRVSAPNTNRMIDIDAPITTTDGADLNLTGYNTDTGIAVDVDADLYVAGDLNIIASERTFRVQTDNITAGGDIYILSYSDTILDSNFTSGGNFTLEKFSHQQLTLSSGHVIDSGGDIYLRTGGNGLGGVINMQSGSGLEADGSITLISEGNINIQTGSSLTTTAGGDIVLNADSEANQKGAISISGATISTNGGNFIAGGGSGTLGGVNGILGDGDGTGADDVAAHAAQDGVYDIGVLVQASNINTGAGNISIRGIGENTNADNYGVYLHNGTTLNTTTGTITLNGTGGDGDNNNYGVFLFEAGTSITSVDGAIDITGQGGVAATGVFNHGVYLHDGPTIQSTGTTADAATITIDGTGGAGGNGEGVYVHGGSILSAYGDIDITGRNLAGESGRGIFVSGFDTTAANTRIVSSGTGANAANISLNGTSETTDGIFLHVAAVVETVDGDISITGQGNRGVFARYSSLVRSTGTGADAGTITISGTGIDGTATGHGVEIAQNSFLRSADGNINITGTGGDSTGSAGHGVIVGESAAGYILSTGAADITLNGTAGDCAGGSCYGFYMPDATGTEHYIRTDGTGNISITGQGGNIGNNNYGIFLEGGSYIESTMAGANAGTITLNGTGGESGDQNYGVYLTGATTEVTAVDGAIDITGVGGLNLVGGFSNNYGIFLEGGATVISTGTGVNAATITLDGTGRGDDLNYGVHLTNAGTLITSVDGAIDITGVGGGYGVNNVANNGIYLLDEADITSTGTGVYAASITLDGTGGDGRTNGRGVALEDTGTSITTIDGDISITGQGGNGYEGGFTGIEIARANVTSTGTGAEAGNITLNGTGGAGTDDNRGVLVWVSGLVTAVDGDISLTGQGGGDGTGIRNIGIQHQFAGRVSVTGTGVHAGNIVYNGTGGNGTTENSGVAFYTSGAAYVTAADGDITITATGTNGANDLFFETGFSQGIGAGGMTGDITLNVNSINEIEAADNIITQGNVSILNRTASTTIGLGGGAGTLNLDDAELGAISSGGTLRIGGDNAGAVEMDAFDVSAGGYDLRLYGSNFTVNGAVNAGPSLWLLGGGDVTLNNTISASGGGNSVVIHADRFENSAGAGAINAGAGRYLVYASGPNNLLRDGLAGTILNNRSFAANPPASILTDGNLFLLPTPPVPQEETNMQLPSSVLQQMFASEVPRPPAPLMRTMVISYGEGATARDEKIMMPVPRGDQVIKADHPSRDSGVRMVATELAVIEQPLLDFFNLCSYDLRYCSR